MIEKLLCVAFAGVIFVLGMVLVSLGGAWAAFGVVAMMWGNNLSRDVAKK